MSALGHKRTFRHVRPMSALPPESGHSPAALRCPLWARSGHRQPYSITSSARASSAGGTVRPSAVDRCRLARGPAAKEPDHRHCRLLRARRERPRCRAAEKRNELTTPHARPPTPEGHRSDSNRDIGRDQRCPLWARSGLMHCSKQHLYSITSSAREQCPLSAISDNSHRTAYSISSLAKASNVGGIVSPSAFAVFMLITSSNLVACSTGKSAGLAPFSILSM
jgi:hypothetical protein